MDLLDYPKSEHQNLLLRAALLSQAEEKELKGGRHVYNRPWSRGDDNLETHIVHCRGFFLHRGAVNDR